MIIQFCKGFPFYYHVSVIQKCMAAFSQPVCNAAQSILQLCGAGKLGTHIFTAAGGICKCLLSNPAAW